MFWRKAMQILTISILLMVVIIAPTSAENDPNFPASVTAESWYVQPNGNDSNGCLSPGPTNACATIQAALNKSSSGDTIFVAVGTYTDTGDEVVLLDKSVILSGGWDSIFTSQNGTSTIDGEDMRRGMTNKSGVTATIERFTFQNGEPAEKMGGGILNAGTITIDHTTIHENYRMTSGSGGGIYNADSGGVTLNNSSISHNGNLDMCLGSGIYNEGIFTINNSTISENEGTGRYCRESTIFNNGVMTITHSIIRDNKDGGGIVNSCKTTACNPMGKVTLNNSTILNNKGASGIFVGDGVVVVENSTISGNSTESGGGIYNGGTLILTNSTISGNSTIPPYESDCGGSCSGGGIYNHYGTVYLNNSTVSNNYAEDYGGGIYNMHDLQWPGRIYMRNTILAGNQTKDNTHGPDCYQSANDGEVTSENYNLIGNTYGCNFNPGTGDLIGINPKLDVLEGFPAYHPLQVDSPALHTGNPAGCSDHLGNPLPFDQRGLPRVDVCDIGAVEMQTLEWSDKTASESRIIVRGSSAFTITLHNLTSDDLHDVTATDTMPDTMTYEPNSLQASSGSYGYENGAINWLGSVDAGGQETITFKARINDDVLPGTIITNSTTIQGGGDTWVRSATVEVIPFNVFLSCLMKNFCPDFFDDFSDPASGWFVGDDQYHLVDYFNQEYRVLTKQSEYIYLFRAPTCVQENYVVEADMRWNGDDYGYGYGLLFGLNGDYSQYYYFEVLALDQSYRLIRRDSSGFSLLTGPTNHWAINSGNSVNHLKVTREGDQITLNVNGDNLGTWTDGVITGLTYTGVATNPYLDKPVSDLRVDNFSAEYLSGGATSSMQTNNAVAVWLEKVHFRERAVDLDK